MIKYNYDRNNDYSDIVRLLMYVVIFIIIVITIVKAFKELRGSSDQITANTNTITENNNIK